MTIQRKRHLMELVICTPPLLIRALKGGQKFELGPTKAVINESVATSHGLQHAIARYRRIGALSL
ncbi:hypothetical protein OUZ56_015703 [Daphnia magna]|uniref:Uncharacterized protein n=1 Tax=Daphnia magna TaxID=35525 RepID=A0ABR0ANH9_9CRUS|nr:hypothetical protein OUZ56_015703 [Daphnia magna]